MTGSSSKLLEFDKKLAYSYNDHFIVGIDEVGRGALAGPVIACAFAWKKNINLEDNNDIVFRLNDSKQLEKTERTKLCKFLVRNGDFGLGYASVLEIEKLNILNATFLAMKRAFDELILKIRDKNLKSYVLIDGNKFNPYINSLQISIIHGDAKSLLIASASIVAKVYRDKLMYKISRAKKFNKFGWRTNVGYGTSFHREAIRIHGVTPLHRKLFIRKVLAFS